MSSKDIEKGIEIATNATKDFIKKTEKGIREVENRIIKKLDEHGQITNAILEELNRQEAKELYDIVIQNDITNLGENEKAVLCNCIFALMENYHQNTETQKKYYMAISKYLKFSFINENFNYEVIENIDSKNDCMLITKSVCEFLFLNSGNFDFLDDFDWLFSIIYIRKKDLNQLCTEISRIYNTLGIDGILNHYINPGEDKDYFDSIVGEFDTTNYTDIENLKKVDTKTNLDNTASTASSLNDSDLEHLYLTKSEDYNESIRFYRKKISITNVLTLNAEALFEECIIEYKLIGTAQIIIGNEAKISFINCKFICNEFLEKAEKYLIELKENTNNQNICFERCVFDNCQNILNSKRITRLNDASITNCFIYFSQNILTIEGIAEHCVIENNAILIDNTSKEKTVFSIRYSNKDIVSNVEIKNNLFLGLLNLSKEQEFSQDNVVLLDDSLSIDSCTFINLNECIEHGCIYNCEFIKCNQPIRYSEAIQNCIFNNCNSPKENLINNVFDCNIDLCQFLNCTAPIIHSNANTSFTRCSFKGIKICEEQKDYYFVDKVLFKQNTNKYHDEILTIDNCTFYDIELNNGVLAKCQPDNKKSSIPGVIFKNCSFDKLHSKRKDRVIIKKTAQVKSLFGKETVTSISIENCLGLETFDNESLCCKQYKPEKIKSDGTLIGANYSENGLESFLKCIDLKRNMFTEKTEGEKRNLIYNSIIDFLNAKDGNIYIGRSSEENLKNILLQFTNDKNTNPNDLIGLYNGSINIKDCFGKDLNGILFLKNGFYFKQHANSSSIYMDYSNIEYAYSEYIKGKDGTKIETKSALSLYSSSEIRALFNNIAKIIQH